MAWSIKPGRGPSAFGAAGSVFAAIFGILWTILAFSMTRDAPFPIVKIVFPLFGVIFVAMAIMGAIYHSRNATQPNRFSSFDVLPHDQESDPLDPTLAAKDLTEQLGSLAPSFCTACGHPFGVTDRFCASCGRAR